MKLKLVRLEDFITELRENNIIKAYFLVDSRQQPIGQPEGEGPPPLLATSSLLLTAKTLDDKKHFIFQEVLKSSEIKNEKEFTEHEQKVKTAISEFISEYQGRYPKCHLIEGVIE